MSHTIPADVLVVITSLPDRISAEKLPDVLIEQRVAACVNILAPRRSVYNETRP